MAAGIVIDTVVARSLLVPALVALFGRAGMWPGRRRVRELPRDRDEEPDGQPRPSLSGRRSLTGQSGGLWSRGR